MVLVPIRLPSEASSWASLDEPRSASRSCSCQYVFFPRPLLGQASMSLQAPRDHAPANTFSFRGLFLGKLDEPRSALRSRRCQYVFLRRLVVLGASLDEPRSASRSCYYQYVFLRQPVRQASMSLEAPRDRATANTFSFRGLFLGKPR